MGNRPIGVIHGNTARDFQLIYEAGIEEGNRSEKDRAEFKDVLNWWRRTSLMRSKEILAISSVNRFRDTLKSGHNVQLLEPELIVEELRWVYSQLTKKNKPEEFKESD